MRLWYGVVVVGSFAGPGECRFAFAFEIPFFWLDRDHGSTVRDGKDVVVAVFVANVAEATTMVAAAVIATDCSCFCEATPLFPARLDE